MPAIVDALGRMRLRYRDGEVEVHAPDGDVVLRAPRGRIVMDAAEGLDVTEAASAEEGLEALDTGLPIVSEEGDPEAWAQRAPEPGTMTGRSRRTNEGLPWSTGRAT